MFPLSGNIAPPSMFLLSVCLEFYRERGDSFSFRVKKASLSVLPGGQCYRWAWSTQLPVFKQCHVYVLCLVHSGWLYPSKDFLHIYFVLSIVVLGWHYWPNEANSASVEVVVQQHDDQGLSKYMRVGCVVVCHCVCCEGSPPSCRCGWLQFEMKRLQQQEWAIPESRRRVLMGIWNIEGRAVVTSPRRSEAKKIICGIVLEQRKRDKNRIVA